MTALNGLVGLLRLPNCHSGGNLRDVWDYVFFFPQTPIARVLASDEYDSLGKTITGELLPFEISLQIANRSRLGGRESSSFLCGMEFCKIVIQEACTLKGGLSTVGG
jgi:hypothetical protein